MVKVRSTSGPRIDFTSIRGTTVKNPKIARALTITYILIQWFRDPSAGATSRKVTNSQLWIFPGFFPGFS